MPKFNTFTQALRGLVLALLLLLPLLGAPGAANAAVACTICNQSAPNGFMEAINDFNSANNPQSQAARAWMAQHCNGGIICGESPAIVCDRLTNEQISQGYTCVCGPTTEQQCPAGGSTGSPAVIKDPLGNATIPVIVGRFTSLMLGISGSLALLMFVWGGFRMVTSAGNEKSYTAGLNSLKAATLGLLVIFASYAVLNFILSAIGGA